MDYRIMIRTPNSPETDALLGTVLNFSEKYLASPENRPQSPVKSVDIAALLASLNNEEVSAEHQAALDEFIDSYIPPTH